MEPDLNGATQAATAEPTATEAANPEGWSLEELREVMRGVVEERLTPMWQAVDRRLGGVETVTPQVMSALQEVRSIRPLIDKLVTGETMEPAELDKLRLAAENEALKQDLAASKKPQRESEPQEQGDDPDVMARRLVSRDYFNGGIKDALKRLFDSEGVDFGTDAKPSALRQKIESRSVAVSSKDGTRMWGKWLDDAITDIKAEADKAEQPARAVIPAAANGGAGIGEKELVGKLARGEHLEPALMFQATQAWKKGVRP